ncbi:MAG: 30S ribosomal protein S3 [Candidatus Yanofskybacteria bacterium CG10_big_fil_rev_8_21_14_0_10_36_16]|uniref:Small ribosomal subunit protein uS3 n=1 Tax=Candidatus Yanofskybacteria bacterium CG10_big_fil_rev_8_21_14_0_10_36_16 TaxID=1975096 RepID=A0A2J0QB12_9BACT|nr:MAG: 30S ribosomal protein S3 [Candidatus Yanofskybacteria bacterium CG10_big_fil_rev_8_21_14_0_10_36_16]
MGHKISPTSLRVGISKDWKSKWFGARKYKDLLKEDYAVREFLTKRLKNMSVEKIEIERSPDTFIIAITTARPGLIIGRSGAGVEELKTKIKKLLGNNLKVNVKIDILEFKNPESSANIMAESIAEQIERRVPFRRVIKQTLSKILAGRDVKGAKVQVAGRLNGAEIARTEHLEEGNLPLQTIKADIDYAQKTAHTTYGTIGVKVWIYREN